MSKQDSKRKIVEQVIEMIKENPQSWSQPWTNVMEMPTRSTGEYYQGMNILILGIAKEAKGYKNKYWFTYRQAQEMGAQVRKGEKAVHICKFLQFVPASEKSKPKDEQKWGKMLKTYAVFNGDQLDNLPERYKPVKFPKKVKHESKAVREFAVKAGASIVDGGDSACYIPSADIIRMPESENFTSTEAWSATLLHELVHWTGHKSRLDRKLETHKHETSYAFEELIAELGSIFLCQELQVNKEPNPNQAAYLKAWLKNMAADPDYLFQAMSKAGKARDYLLQKKPEEVVA